MEANLTAREVGLFMQDCIRKYYSTSGWTVERKGIKRLRAEAVKDVVHEEMDCEVMSTGGLRNQKQLGQGDNTAHAKERTTCGGGHRSRSVRILRSTQQGG
ncbi:hypothetical protein Y032_0015g2545 [Ancylostoma ceylanicum]|nr:hypothetical protein Y032_0015g2545 [Ancylostoma ceylanicum]